MAMNGSKQLFLLFLVLTASCAALVSGGLGSIPMLRLIAWAASVAAVLAFLASLDVTPWRALLDEYNRGNLQQAITAAWFVLLTSALITGSFINIFVWARTGGAELPSFVRIDASVWVLAGIALGGTVLNRVIDTRHATTPASDRATETVWSQQPDRVGLMYVRPAMLSESYAREAGERVPSTVFALLSDSVKGRQKGTESEVDIGPVQQLLLQMTTWVGYVVAVGVMFHKAEGQTISSLPSLPSELLTLLGVSAAGQALLAAVPAKPVQKASVGAG